MLNTKFLIATIEWESVKLINWKIKNITGKRTCVNGKNCRINECM